VEPGVVLQGRDDADEVPLVQMLKVREGQLVRVVGEVDCVHVPRHLSYKICKNWKKYGIVFVNGGVPSIDTNFLYWNVDKERAL
jgi:hypothetical protein